MNQEFVLYLSRETFYTALLITAPILIVSMLVGFVVSLIQAVTSIQEQTMVFVPKILAVAAVILLMLPWFLDTLTRFALFFFQQMETLGR